LTGNELKIIYRPGIDKETRSQTEENYLKKLELLREQEIAKGVTTMGPHRDDFKILLEEEKQDKVISKDLGVYGSRGEQRTAALGLKLSEVSLLEKERGEKPVLLLDEVLSELDQKHRTLLLNLLKKEQSFITTTSLEAVEKVLGKNLKKFFVESGIAKQV
jgi:DNA replication and repair protein RecF